MINLTPLAVTHIKNILESMPGSLGIRVGVKESGCSGLSYVLDFVKELNPADNIFQIDGVQVVVDRDSLPYLDGMELDCHHEGLNAYLKFNNPNVTGACGCGESFTVQK